MSKLHLLAKQIKSFPITGLGIVQCADHLGYDDEAINFLKLFSQKMVFNSRTDFVNHCSLLERLLKEERQSVPEYLSCAQDQD
jgi:hypothetical protein